MSLAVINSRAHTGMVSQPVSVEVHLASGLPSLSIVGMPETAVKESKDRVRSAIINGGFEFPAKRITINLAPADLPKEGGRYDLPIALGILIASRQISVLTDGNAEFIGELALGGQLRPVSAVLPSIIAARDSRRPIYVPRENASEATLVKGVTVYSVKSLAEVAGHLQNQTELNPAISVDSSDPRDNGINLGDVRGQQGAKRALTLAAAGEHHIMLMGPPGSGKTMLARCLPGLLPKLSDNEALESATIYSLSQYGFDVSQWRERPFRSPHHSSSVAALVGGGSNPKPGEISLAHNGVLFLDELPEFGAQLLDQLREPIETGTVNISRVNCKRTFPARFQLVCAMNLCKCGKLGDPRSSCQCSPEQINRYQRKISGPLLDRIDLQVHLKPISFDHLVAESKPIDDTEIKQKVHEVRQRQLERQGCSNARLNDTTMGQHCTLPKAAKGMLQMAVDRLALSARSFHRIVKVARTAADLDGMYSIGVEHVAEAIQLRTGQGQTV